jgi:hypothetical protein
MDQPDNSRNVREPGPRRQSERDDRRAQKQRSGILCNIEDATYAVLRKHEKIAQS